MLDKLEEGVDANTSGNVLFCTVVTPEATVLEMAARFVVLPLVDGEIGIAPGHSPLIGRLGYGQLRAVDGERRANLYIDGGFVEVVGNQISVLTNRAVPAKDLDAAVLEEQLKTSLAQGANTPERLAQRDRVQLQTRAQLRIARREKSGVASGH